MVRATHETVDYKFLISFYSNSEVPMAAAGPTGAAGILPPLRKVYPRYNRGINGGQRVIAA